MAHEPGSSGNGAPRGSADTSFAAGGYRARATGTEETAARLRQSLADLLAVAQDYAARRLREARAALRLTAREMAIGAALLVMAAAVGGLAVCLGVAGCVLLLMLVLPAWVAVWIMCGILLLMAVVFGLVGIRRLRARRLAAMLRTVQEDMDRVRAALFGPYEDRAQSRATAGSAGGESRRT
jgi:hypothetical protein